MKKIIPMLLVLVMLLSLCACTVPTEPMPTNMPSKPVNSDNSGSSAPAATTAPAACQHNYDSNVTAEASCLTEGTMEHCCSLCGDKWTEAIPATGHSFNLGSCAVCGEADPNFRELTTALGV